MGIFRCARGAHLSSSDVLSIFNHTPLTMLVQTLNVSSFMRYVSIIHLIRRAATAEPRNYWHRPATPGSETSSLLPRA